MRTPKAFSKRSAMSPERSACPFSRFDSAGRDTPSICAAAVTDRASGFRISVRINSPGCGGFAIRPSVVVLIIPLNQFVVVDAEGQPPIARDVESPRAFPVAAQLVRFPRRERAQFVDVAHVL